MSDEVFDTRFDAALKKAAVDQGKDPDLVEIALDVHSALCTSWAAKLRACDDADEAEQRKLEATRQALVCYQILWAVNTLEVGFDVGRIALRLGGLQGGKRDRAAELMTHAFRTLDSLEGLERAARNLLADLGLPMTIADFGNLDTNCFRIQIDTSSCKIASPAYADALNEQLQYIVSGLPGADP
jgi:hypothetical protein